MSIEQVIAKRVVRCEISVDHLAERQLIDTKAAVERPRDFLDSVDGGFLGDDEHGANNYPTPVDALLMRERLVHAVEVIDGPTVVDDAIEASQ